ncbi:EAL domain-containing protein [Chromobacterium subtsugae]|uniref:EAL domain-containing response regulator n=1 Tax=Chromobacterium subtsugae TaxID=251747 RepID=UPI000640FB72|nr:EAL domain-containing protein [Chromobacterium subtsugae]
MPRQILIAEDSPGQLQLLAELCRKLPDTEVFEASDGRWAMQTAQRHPQLDLVVTDLNMPGMDGIELVQALSHRIHLPALMFLSGDVPELLAGCSRAAEALGFSQIDSCAKPIDPDRLLARVHRLLQGCRPPSRPDIAIALTEIMTGLAHNQFCAFYQPIFNQQNHRAGQMEALARWRHPLHGLLGPQHFIDRLEHDGTIMLLTRRMAQTSLDLLSLNSWTGGMRVSINLSRSLLHDREFFDWLQQEVELRRIAPGQVVLEITETLAFNNLGNTLASLLRMRMRGFELSLDDYGAGNTTLEHVRDLPLTELKLDRSLILDIHRDRRSQGILASTVEMGRRLGLRMVAEGIDNPQDFAYLRQHYPDLEMQGFYLSRPMSAAELPLHLSWSPDGDSASA